MNPEQSCVESGVGEDEENSCLVTLPPEIMYKIFTNTDNSTFHKVITAKGCWNELLQPCKNEFLFPLIFPDVLPYLRPKNILNLRLVSRAVKGTVDFVLQYGPLRRTSDDKIDVKEHVPMFKVPTSLDVYQFTTIRFTVSEDIERFLGGISQANMNKNPFPWRAVQFAPVCKNVSSERLTKFEKLVKILLRQFGKHVYRLTYKLPLFLRRQDAIMNMVYILNQVENVRFLRLEERWMGSLLDGGFQWMRLGEEEEELFRKENLELPQLSKLKILHLPKLDEYNYVAVQLIRSAYHEKVGCIKVHMTGFESVEYDDHFA